MRRKLQSVLRVLPLVTLAMLVGWLCCPGRFSYFNVWLVMPGMSLERVQWLMGGPGQELSESQLPQLQNGKPLLSGERVYQWSTTPGTFLDGRLIVSFEAGAVKEKDYSETPLF